MKRDWILHGEINLSGTDFSIADCNQIFPPSHFVSLMVRLGTPEEVRRVYDELQANGGQVLMEIAPQFYAKMYA